MRTVLALVMLLLAIAGCGHAVASDANDAATFAASELALLAPSEYQPPVEPAPKPRRRDIGNAGAVDAEERPEVIFWTRRGCEPCKAILAELEACKKELPFVVTPKDDTHKQPKWLPSWPTLHWCIDTDKDTWKSFSPSEQTPWPGVDEFVRMWRKSFPLRAAQTGQPLGVSAGALPIRGSVEKLKQALSIKGLSLPYGVKLTIPGGKLIASATQRGSDVLVEFDRTTRPHVSFGGVVNQVIVNEKSGKILIDGLPDLTFEVTP